MILDEQHYDLERHKLRNYKNTWQKVEEFYIELFSQILQSLQ